MSETTGSETGGSFSSSAGGSSLASDNTDTRALNSLQEGNDGDEAGDDLGTNNKSFQEGLFATLHTLTKNRTMDTSLRVATLRTVLEFMQFFRIVVNSSFPWVLQHDLWAFKTIEWTLIRPLVNVHGYAMYITVFYIISGVTLTTIALTVWVALVLKGSDTANPWLRRLIGLLQLVALVVFCIAWPTVLGYTVFLYNCDWSNIQEGLPAVHVYFTEQTCTAMPHLAHMMFAGVMTLLMSGMVLLMGMGACDVDPLNRSRLSSSDEVTTIKMLVLKIIFVIVATMLDQLTSIQAGFMMVAMWGVVYYHFDGVPYYNKVVNVIWGGLWVAILDVTVILLVTQVTIGSSADPVALKDFMTKIMIYTIFPAMAAGAALMCLRLHYQAKLARSLHNSFNVCKAAVLTNTLDMGVRNSNCVVAMMGDLKKVHRFRDVRQVKIMCREMRRFDDEGQPEQEAIEFGEFLIKCGMARMPNNPSLLVMYASYMIVARKDGQAARTQLQLAQKANPSILDTYYIYIAQQLAKQLKRDGDGLDLLSYVEFQRNYLACVRNHKAALMTQRAFWNCLLRDTISFRDLQASVQAMEAAEQRATAVYRRVMERYPGKGKVMKVYARFLEFVRNEPGAASRFYEAAIKAGTSESLLALTAAEGGTAGLAAAGQIDEKVDGLAVINAQGSIMMVNQATLSMFGYQKGELEGKNVSVLMPQPYSSRHDSFLQRHVESGQHHILNKTREVVALHKDHQMFPISLCVARLSGAGMDTLLIGVMRHSAAAGSLDNQIVKLWMTSTGMIMCADSSLADALAINAGDLVGRSFSNLCTDVEGVTRYITNAAQRQESVDAQGAVVDGPTFRTKMVHAFLPPVDVELSLSFGGAVEAGSDCRSIIMSARVLAEAAAVMVVDHKGRILHATAKLAQMLGVLVAKMTKMELSALLPQPVTQMHGAWFKDPPLRIPATSCRAGGVVHLLAANGTKVPVTLKMSTKEDPSTGHLTHVVQVTRASEEQRLDQQRMMLSINHKGVILSVNPGVPKSLFGFDAHQLVGQPVSQCVDIFSEWKQGHGEELSLLELLVTQVMATSSQTSKSGSGCSAWRVGVHRPVADDHHDVTGGAATNSSSLLRALQPNRVQPACMKLEPMLQDASDLLIDDESADSTPMIQVAIFRSDALVTVLDLDRHLNVARADDTAGLLFGVSAKTLSRKSFASLVGITDVKCFDDLLGKDGAAKKGAMKGGTAATSRAGAIRHITGVHLGDGQPLSLSMQAMSYTEQGGQTRQVVRLQLLNPVSAAMHRLLAIKEGAESALQGVAESADAESEDAARHRVECPDSPSSSKGSDHGGGLTAEPSTVDAAPAPRNKHDRIKQWVRQASELRGSEGDSASDGSQSPQHMSPQHHHKHGAIRNATEADAQCDVRLHAPGGRSKGKHDAIASQSEEGADSMKNPVTPKAGRFSENGEDAASSFAGSMADGGMSDAGSGVESSMATGAAGHEEDLAVDMRRVKRLKKVSRMLASSIAQAATLSWKQCTLYLLAVILAAHVACFAVIVTQVESRHANALSVDNIARAMSASSQSVMRSLFIQKCVLPEFAGYKACDPSMVDYFATRLAKRTEEFRTVHHQLYLGGGEGNFKPFSDPRLVNYWTYKQLPETLYFQQMPNGLPAFANSTRTLWEMGNILVAAFDDILFSWKKWGTAMEQQPSFQYAMLQGTGPMFTAYSWSLDTFVDYAWQDLTKLSIIIIVLLVIEAAVVQLSCMAYEFLLLQRCNVAHMRMFSVFLALPSATVRFMVRQPMIIDDSTADDMDDDQLELVEGAAAAGQATVSGAPQGGAIEIKKSVRLAADDDDDGMPANANKEGRGSKKKSLGEAAVALVKKSSKAPVSSLAAFKDKAHKYLFGWLDPKFKRNGKKLSPSSRIIFQFMAPLLLWVAAVVVIFGVSYSNLQDLQGPLASQDVSSHVMYRLTRVRLMGALLAFSISDEDNAQYRAALKEELALLREEYRTLLYGGHMRLQAEVTFDPVAPPAIIKNAGVAEMFFTTECTRADKTTCLPPGDIDYRITHSGLDAQINRYMDEMATFSNLPDALAMANHSSYEWTMKVTAKDTMDGVEAASKLFANGTVEKLEGVKQLHIILLVISLFALVMFFILLYRPYIKVLRRDTKAVVNMLSQLPAEVDVEGHVKTIVLGIVKTEGARSMPGLPQGPGTSTMQMQQYGMGPPGMMGGAGMRGGPPQRGMAPGAQAGGGWFNRRTNAGPQSQANDPGMYCYGMHNSMGTHNNGGAAW